jgi:hypothetical protein
MIHLPQVGQFDRHRVSPFEGHEPSCGYAFLFFVTLFAFVGTLVVGLNAREWYPLGEVSTAAIVGWLSIIARR